MSDSTSAALVTLIDSALVAAAKLNALLDRMEAREERMLTEDKERAEEKEEVVP